jgi:hypothetical protein
VHRFFNLAWVHFYRDFTDYESTPAKHDQKIRVWIIGWVIITGNQVRTLTQHMGILHSEKQLLEEQIGLNSLERNPSKLEKL